MNDKHLLIKELTRQYIFEADAYTKKFGKRYDFSFEKYVSIWEHNNIAKYAIRMTDIEKLGINPKYGFSNPRGIYAYPLTSPIYDQLRKNELPYVSDAKYIIVFEIKNPNKWLDVSEDDGFYNQDWQRVCRTMYDEAVKRSKVKEPMSYDKVMAKAISEAEHWDVSDGAKIYDFGFYLTEYFFTESRKSAEWQNLLLKAGFEGVYDDGSKVLHVNEPRQLVALKKDAIQQVEIFDTKSFRRGMLPLPNAEKVDFSQLPFGHAAKLAVSTTNAKILDSLADHERKTIHTYVATNKATSAKTLDKLATPSCPPMTAAKIAENKNTSVETLIKLSKRKEYKILSAVLLNEKTPLSVFEDFSNDSNELIQELLAVNKRTPAEILDKLADRKIAKIMPIIASNPNVSLSTLQKVLDFTTSIHGENSSMAMEIWMKMEVKQILKNKKN